jgi:hypothetical protein
VLHVTNGDVVAELLAATGLPGGIVTWADPLHEGPVPSGLSPARLDRLRAEFIERCGWGTFEDALDRFTQRREALAAEPDEVVLWFEHDLFDQLQLIQVLDALAGGGKRPAVSLVGPGDYLSGLGPGQLAALAPSRERLGEAAFSLACRAWDAFRAPDPRALAELAAAPTPALEYLGPALRRHLEDLPSVHDGLSRTERQILELLSQGVDDRFELFRRNAELEEAIYMGDTVFFLHVRRLDAARALLDRGTVGLTPFGRELLTGGADLVRDAGIDRWLGGIKLRGRRIPWRWSPKDGAPRPLPDNPAWEPL